jgi:hypothetical protein
MAGDEAAEPWMMEVLDSFGEGPILDLVLGIFLQEMAAGIEEMLDSITINMSSLISANLAGQSNKFT